MKKVFFNQGGNEIPKPQEDVSELIHLMNIPYDRTPTVAGDAYKDKRMRTSKSVFLPTGYRGEKATAGDHFSNRQDDRYAYKALTSNSPKNQQRRLELAKKGYDEYGDNPYTFYDENGILRNDFDGFENLYGLQYGEIPISETYDSNNNLIDYDYGPYDPEQFRNFRDNIVLTGNRYDFYEPISTIHNPDGSTTYTYRSPRLIDREWYRVSPWRKGFESFARNIKGKIKDIHENLAEYRKQRSAPSGNKKSAVRCRESLVQKFINWYYTRRAKRHPERYSQS